MLARFTFTLLVAVSGLFAGCKPPEDSAKKDLVYTQQGATIASQANQKLAGKGLDILSDNFSWNTVNQSINRMNRADLQFCLARLDEFLAGINQTIDGLNSSHVQPTNGMSKQEMRSGFIGIRARGQIVKERVQARLELART